MRRTPLTTTPRRRCVENATDAGAAHQDDDEGLQPAGGADDPDEPDEQQDAEDVLDAREVDAEHRTQLDAPTQHTPQSHRPYRRDLKTGVSYSPQCRQRTAILLLELQMIMHTKRAIYSSNSVFNYRTSGHSNVYYPRESFREDYGITGARLSVCLFVCLFVCYHDN